MLKTTSSHESDWVFEHNLIESVDYERIEEDGKRLYVTPRGNYPSVTTALSHLNKKKLDEWRARVGDKWADEHSSRAARKGTALHETAEKFLMNDPQWKKAMPITLMRFKPIAEVLKENVDLVYGIELRLYSSHLQTAGTADLACVWNGKNTIADFKTAGWEKGEDDILGYFIQTTAYSMMMKELFDIDIEQIVIIMSVEAEDRPVLFIKDPKKYVRLTETYFNMYHEGKL